MHKLRIPQRPNENDDAIQVKERQKLRWPSRRQKVFDGLLVAGLDRVLPSHCRMTRLPFSGHSTRVRAHLSGITNFRPFVHITHMCSPPK